MSENISSQLTTISTKVTTLSASVDSVERALRAQGGDECPTAITSETPASQTPRLWCDRPLDELLPTGPLIWPDKDDETEGGDVADNGCQLHRVSKATETFLDEAFLKPVSNATRRRWRKTYGMPATEVTKCPSWTPP